MARRLHDRAWKDIGKSIEEDKKSKYYKDKIKSMNNSKVIYNDDPNAIEKLKEKLAYLENERKLIKEDENHTGWQLQNIGARIRETRKRIEKLEELENTEFKTIKFVGGEAIHNKEKNRIQLFFDYILNEETIKELRHRGFRWARSEGAWQREFTENAIKATNILIKDVLNKPIEQEEEEEYE